MDIKGNFNVDYYLRRLYLDPTDKERGVQPFRMACFYKFYENFSSSWDASSAKLLEYGGGPVIYPLISACPYVAEITFSDYQQASLDAVSKWKNRLEGSHDWDPYFRYILSNIEGNENEEAVFQRISEMREKLKHFAIGDILSKDILALDEGLPKEFDVVSCNLCLEVPAKSIDDYKRNVKNLSRLVKPGGFVVSLVVLENSFYNCSPSNERNFLVYLREEDVKEAYEMAGFSIVLTEKLVLEERSRNVIDGSKANFFIVGKKI